MPLIDPNMDEFGGQASGLEQPDDFGGGVTAPPPGPALPPPPPSGGEEPGPVTEPNAGQIDAPPPTGGEPQKPRPRPTNVRGLEESQETGGIRGSFAQAGTSDFNQRFGSNQPALWYRRTLEQLPNVGRRRGAPAGGGPGGGGQLPSPSVDTEVGGRPGEDEWQRFMQGVRRNMFGGG